MSLDPAEYAPCAHRTDTPKRILGDSLPLLPIYGCRWFVCQCADTAVLSEGEQIMLCHSRCEGYTPARATKREAKE
jgi:hypothetical protein